MSSAAGAVGAGAVLLLGALASALVRRGVLGALAVRGFGGGGGAVDVAGVVVVCVALAGALGRVSAVHGARDADEEGKGDEVCGAANVAGGGLRVALLPLARMPLATSCSRASNAARFSRAPSAVFVVSQAQSLRGAFVFV